MGLNLHTALLQFFALFPSLQGREFFITGESYAGKYVPALAWTIHSLNPSTPLAQRINLQGLFIGNGLSDPENMLLYSDLVFQIGLVDDQGRSQLRYAKAVF